jgi:hypothetical protein
MESTAFRNSILAKRFIHTLTPVLSQERVQKDALAPAISSCFLKRSTDNSRGPVNEATVSNTIAPAISVHALSFGVFGLI